MKNPCVSSLVTISAPTLPALRYTISTGEKLFTAHSDFTVVSTPVDDHGLCGPLTITAKYETTGITSTSQPLGYKITEGQFVALSTVKELRGLTKAYSLTATFTNYPVTGTPSTSGDTATASSTITFDNPCESNSDYTLVATTQAATADDKFTDTNIDFTITPFTITPSYCSVTYSCGGVSHAEGTGTSSVQCSDLTFNADGTVSFKASTTDYTTDAILPDTYTVTITATPTESDDAANETVTATYDYQLLDPCLDVAITSTVLVTNIDFILTDAEDTYTPTTLFSITPSYCESSITMTLPSGVTGLDSLLSFDEASQTYTLAQLTNSLDLLDGQLEKTFTITMDYAAGNKDDGSIATEQKTFTLTLKNPCVTSLVTITAPTFREERYLVGTGLKTFVVHPAFTIMSTPVANHNLCGGLTLTAFAEDEDYVLNNANTPVTYSSANA